MNILSLIARFPDQHACITHLEQVRWGDKPACPHCGSLRVARKAENQRIGRWNCHDCKASFNVLSKTIMQKTKIPLVKWFAAIALIVNAKKSLSSCQLARDLEMNQGSAWYIMQRIRAAMAADQGAFLRGIIEADETLPSWAGSRGSATSAAAANQPSGAVAPVRPQLSARSSGAGKSRLW